MSTVALIMAAGQGTRMRSEVPKVLHPVCGWPMIRWPVEAARAAALDKTVVICSPDSGVPEALPAGVETVIQMEARGTGDAVAASAGQFGDTDTVLVLSGDSPLITAEVIGELLAEHGEKRAVATMATAELDDPTGYGRVVRASDGTFQRVAETKVAGDATEDELAIHEVNAGIYVFDGRLLKLALETIKPENAQGELFLPDVFRELQRGSHPVTTHLLEDPAPTFGVNNRLDLAKVTALCQRRILDRHMLAGVTFANPAATVVDVDVQIEPDTAIEPFSSLQGATRIGRGATIGPLTTLVDCEIGAAVHVLHSYLDGCRVAERCAVGPFAYIRPGTVLGEGAKVGTFVEIKNSEIGAGAKVPHLSYVGDADVGEESNIAAGNITANYDGFRKHRTTIGEKVRTGVDTTFVAPVHVGDDAYTGAGSVITEDVPAGALGIARSRQENVEGFAERKRSENEDEESQKGSKSGNN